MPSFQQCKSCNKFLLSLDPISLAKHSCLTQYDETQATVKRETEVFRLVTFPDLRIYLTRSPSSPMSFTKPDSPIPNASNLRRTKRKIKKRIKYSPLEELLPDEKASFQDEDFSPDEKASFQDEEFLPDEYKLSKRPKQRERYKKEQDGQDGTPYIRTYRFDCDQCPGRFYSKVEYNRHMNVHSGSRRLMTCIVCLRIFNKRDSLNHHYASHENAEEREEKLDLMNSWPQITRENPYARNRQACKYCLLVHTNQQSFVNHIRSDHDGEASRFPCRLDNCAKIFTKIKDLMIHAKELHPLAFYGKFTLNRIKGIAKIGERSTYNLINSANPTEEDVTPKNVKISKTSTLNKSKATSKPKKRKKKMPSLTMSHYESDSGSEIINFEETRTRRRKQLSSSERFDERTVELERVHIVEETAENCTGTCTVVKKENAKFYYQDELDPFLMYEQTNQNLSDSMDKIDKNNEGNLDKDSVPIVMAVKSEPMMY